MQLSIFPKLVENQLITKNINPNLYKIQSRRYTGSKAKLVDWIFQLINKECKGKIFADLFAGTGVVAADATNYFEKIFVNDFLYSNFAIYKAFFEKGTWDKRQVERIVENYNKINPDDIEDNYFSNNFGGKYFSFDSAKKIGYIREDLEHRKEEIGEKGYFVILTSLLFSLDKIANTVGHYDAFFKKEPKSTLFIVKLIEPIDFKEVKIYKEDSNKLAETLNADVVYIDPPYNSRQYSRFYHVLETLVKWDKPILFGTALKPAPENISSFSKSSASKSFSELINMLRCSYIAVSYNNTYNSRSNSSKNKIELDFIKKILESKGPTKIFSTAHKYFNAGNTSFEDHQELLFITSVI